MKKPRPLYFDPDAIFYYFYFTPLGDNETAITGIKVEKLLPDEMPNLIVNEETLLVGHEENAIRVATLLANYLDKVILVREEKTGLLMHTSYPSHWSRWQKPLPMVEAIYKHDEEIDELVIAFPMEDGGSINFTFKNKGANSQLIKQLNRYAESENLKSGPKSKHYLTYYLALKWAFPLHKLGLRLKKMIREGDYLLDIDRRLHPDEPTIDDSDMYTL
jgi:hypothetical protein